MHFLFIHIFGLPILSHIIVAAIFAGTAVIEVKRGKIGGWRSIGIFALARLLTWAAILIVMRLHSSIAYGLLNAALLGATFYVCSVTLDPWAKRLKQPRSQNSSPRQAMN